MKPKPCVKCPQNGDATKSCISFDAYSKTEARLYAIGGAVMAAVIIAIESKRLLTIITIFFESDPITLTAAIVVALLMAGVVWFLTEITLSVKMVRSIDYGVVTLSGPSLILTVTNTAVTYFPQG